MNAIQAHLDETDGRESERMINSLERLDPQIERVIEQYPETSGNYWMLLFRFFNTYHSDKVRITVKGGYDKLHDLPSPESISRVFRWVIKRHPELPTARTIAKRARREMLVRDIARNKI
jgi:hypothetical protein